MLLIFNSFRVKIVVNIHMKRGNVMEVFTVLLFTFSMFAVIIFFILFLLNKIIFKKATKPLWAKGLKISAIVFVLSIALAVKFVPTDTSNNTRVQSKKKEEVKATNSVPIQKTQKANKRTKKYVKQKRQTRTEKRVNKFVKEVQKVTEGALGRNQRVTGVEYKNRNLTVYADLSQATPDPLTYEDLVITGTSSVTDEVLTLTDYFDLWDTVTVDFGEFGRIRNSKDNMERNEYGDYYFNSAKFSLEK